MQTLVQRTLDEAATSHPERGIESTVEGDLAGTWDTERLCQVFTNLVGNALHHGSADQPVRICADGNLPETVSITVSNGGTIPPELMPHLFDAFRGGKREPGRHQGWAWGFHCAPDRAGAPRCHRGQVTRQRHDLPGDVARHAPQMNRRRLTPLGYDSQTIQAPEGARGRMQ